MRETNQQQQQQQPLLPLKHFCVSNCMLSSVFSR